MALKLTAEAEEARDLAKRCVPEGGAVEIDVLLRALYHGSSLRKRFPRLQGSLSPLKEQRKDTPDTVPLSAELIPVLTEIASRGGDPLTPEAWFAALLQSRSGRDSALSAGITEEDLDAALRELQGGEPAAPTPSSGESAWRASKERKEVMKTTPWLLTDHFAV